MELPDIDGFAVERIVPAIDDLVACKVFIKGHFVDEDFVVAIALGHEPVHRKAFKAQNRLRRAIADDGRNVATETNCKHRRRRQCRRRS